MRKFVVDEWMSLDGVVQAPGAPEEEQAVAQPLNSKPKYVASTTLDEPLEWENSSVLQGDVAEAVGAR